MNTFRCCRPVALVLLLVCSYCRTTAQGSLVIVGGGLEPDNKSVFLKLVGLAGGPERASFAVIPAAGGAPVQSYAYFRSELISYGVRPENIHLVPVAVADDDSTRDVNEAQWKENGSDAKVAGLVRGCSAVWFTGGDQLRVTRTLQPGGKRTPVLDAVWDVYRSGGVIGGTSAGAAIMSRVMIGGGTSIAALTRGVITGYAGDDFPADSGVLVSEGLGFFPLGIVDQHFLVRARYGRLAMTLATYKDQGALGFGIDENTALIYDGRQNRVEVAGASGVTIIDAAEARLSYVHKLPCIENLSVTYLEEGDSWDPAAGKMIPAAGKQLIRGKEHFSDQYPGGDGTFSETPVSFRELMIRYLADNSVSDSVHDLNPATTGEGFLVTLVKPSSFEGYCGRKPGQQGRYSLARIRMDIRPVQISLTPIKN
jgi:cyanophycinase